MSAELPAPPPSEAVPPPVIHVNMGRGERSTPPEIHINMGRAKDIGEGIMTIPGVDISIVPIQEQSVLRINQQPTPQDKLQKHGLVDASGKLTATALSAFESVGYSNDEIVQMTPEQLWNLRNSETGDIAFGGSPFELGQTTEPENVAPESNFETLPPAEETASKTTVTLENLDAFIEHIKDGGTFDSIGEDGARKLIQKPSGKYDIIDTNSGRVVAGNISERRLRQSFEGRLRDYPGKFSY